MVGVAFLRDLPPRLGVPWSASIARFSLSRSEIRRLSMWSVGIESILTRDLTHLPNLRITRVRPDHIQEALRSYLIA